MSGLLALSSPAETHTGGRRWTDTETPESGFGVFEPNLLISTPPNMRNPQDAVLRLVSGAQEFRIVPSRFGGFIVSSPQGQVFAIPDAPSEDLFTHLGQVLPRIAAILHDVGYADGEERFLTHSAAVPRQRYAGSTSSPTSRRYKRFRGELIAAFLTEPIEDGVTHPAERVIDDALCADSAECQDWLSQVLVETYKARPSIGASIVRCIGRQDYDRVGKWGMRVADHALRHDHVEVRDAAVRALEAWGGSEALGILRGHADSVGWMNDYVQQVIIDLSGTAS